MRDNRKMEKADVVIILGGGIDKKGRIAATTKQRLEAFLRRKSDFSGAPVILSGGWSGLDKPKVHATEAMAMKKYFIAKGIEPSPLYLEEKSLDTIGNAIFSKKLVKKHKRWKRITVISSAWHLSRTKWIFNKVFGGRYALSFFPALGPSRWKNRVKYERYLLKAAKILFGGVRAGDDIQASEALKTRHPLYSRSSAAKKLLKKITEQRKRLLRA